MMEYLLVDSKLTHLGSAVESYLSKLSPAALQRTNVLRS